MTSETPTVDDAVDAYLWGYPLVVMHRTRLLMGGRTPPGTMNHVSTLATPRDRAVVAPNNDTLYSSGWFDLDVGDLEIEVPATDHPKRYWSVMLLDGYTHVAYVCRRLHGVDGVQATVTLDPSSEPERGGVTIVPMGTRTVWALARVLVDGEADLEAARAFQRAVVVRAPDGHPSAPTERRGRPDRAHEAGAAFFDELRQALAIDPPAPWHPQPSQAAQRVLAGEHDLAPDIREAA